jgi:putative membrane protein (TIGR04086 family)
MGKLGFVKKDFFDIVKGILYSVIISIIFILVYALIIKYSNINDSGIVIGNYIIKALSIFIGTLLGVKNISKGAFKGFLIGLIYIVLSFFLFSLISKSLDFKSITIYDILGSVIIGLLSGIITVNLKSFKKE